MLQMQLVDQTHQCQILAILGEGEADLAVAEVWLHRYNHHRPHESLGRIPSVEYRVKQFPNVYF